MPNPASSSARLLEFHVPFSHTGVVDKENGVIYGVSLITGGIKARGHDLQVDGTTLEQMMNCCVEMGQVPVKWNHKTGADAVNGFIDNFRIDLGQLRGDWHLLKTHSQYGTAIELAERMPKNIGLSAAFLPPLKLAKQDVGKARCEELVSVDLVAQPAANPSGLFSVPEVDRSGKGNSQQAQPKNTHMDPNQIPAEPTLADLMAIIQEQGDSIAQLSTQLSEQNLADAPDLADLAELSQLTDEQLIAAGFDPDQVDAAIQDAIVSGELVVDDGGEGEGQEGIEGEGAGALAGEAATALSDLRRRVEYFETKERREVLLAARDEEQQLIQAVDVVEQKCIALSAENDALRTALVTGAGSAVSPGTEIVLLDQATGKPVTFESIVNTKYVELMRKGDITDVKARSKAIDFGVKRHGAAYREFRNRGGSQIEFSVPQ